MFRQLRHIRQSIVLSGSTSPKPCFCLLISLGMTSTRMTLKFRRKTPLTLNLTLGTPSVIPVELHLPSSNDDPAMLVEEKQTGLSTLPSKPQLHSKKHHSAYNGSQHIPIATWVRLPALHRMWDYDEDDEEVIVYPVTLYYDRNRACTILRTWEDFVTLQRGLEGSSWKAPILQHGSHISLDLFLHAALQKWPREIAMEYFLRRRIGDCGGR